MLPAPAGRRAGGQAAAQLPLTPFHLPLPQAQGSAAEQKELKLVGPEPKRFEVAQGQLKNIATAAFPFLMRLGSGGFASGYSVSLVPQDGKYAIASVLGRNIRETSAVGSFNRPAEPIVLYEFEGERAQRIVLPASSSALVPPACAARAAFAAVAAVATVAAFKRLKTAAATRRA